MNTFKLILLLAISILINLSVNGQEKKFIREYTYQASELDSKISSRAITISQVRQLLLEELGVYVESERLLKTVEIDGKYSQDFIETISTITAGITKLEILEESWNGEKYWMKASITVDKNSLKESLNRLINDKKKIKELQQINEQLEDAKKEIVRLNKELINKQGQNKDTLNENYNNEVGTLITTEYILNSEKRYDDEDYSGAVEDLNKAIKIEPENSMVYYLRGAARIQLNDYFGALLDLNKAIEINSNIPIYYLTRGSSYFLLQDYTNAINDLNVAIESGQLKYLYTMRAMAKDESQDYLGAIEDLNKAIEFNSKDSTAYYQRGMSKIHLNDYRGAKLDLTKAIELAPNQAAFYTARAFAKNMLDEFRDALKDYNKAIELNPVDEKALYYRGLLNIRLNKKNNGCLDLSKAGELGHKNAYEAIDKFCK